MRRLSSSNRLMHLTRRDLLRGGVLTVAGAATLSGAELLRPPAALAQSASSPGALVVLKAGPAGSTQWPYIYRHYYRFDYEFPTPVPIPEALSGLIRTYRLGHQDEGRSLSGSQLRMNFLDRPAQVPVEYYPPTPSDAGTVSCYLYLQAKDELTGRVFHPCSLLCNSGDVIVIEFNSPMGDNEFYAYLVPCLDCGLAGGNIIDETVALKARPGASWLELPVGSVSAIYDRYYVATNQAPFSPAIWRTNINAGDRKPLLQIQAFIPAQPSRTTPRTLKAYYELQYVDNNGQRLTRTVGPFSHRQKGWRYLGTLPFTTGNNYTVSLVNKPSDADRNTMVANAIRWSEV